ncbi:MAG: sugar phosphate isomerase/epimerase family protein [Planctomycetota bacterium]
MKRNEIDRRDWLKQAAVASGALLGASSLLESASAAPAPKPKRWFRVGACDWSLRKTNDPEALRVAKALGIDGVQASFAGPGGRYDLRKKEARETYRKVEKETGTKVASLGLGILNNVPYKSDPRAEEWVSDSIDVAKEMGLSVVLLAFFGRGDLLGDKKGMDEVIRRLKRVAPRAEKAGVVFGLETWLGEGDHRRIIDGVGSKSVQVYYDVGNSLHKGYDIYKEIRSLGREYICEFHAKDYGAKLLGQGDVDFWEVRRAIDDIGFNGWIQIECRAPYGMERSYRHDGRFLKALFSERG